MLVILRVACLLNFLLTRCQAGVLLGCYKESLRSRHFDINPGDYSAEVMTVGTCMAQCGVYKFIYAALGSGKFCFCANSLPDPSQNEASSNCDQPCAGDSGYFCGGLNHVSVYNSGERPTGLSITTDAASDVVETGTQVNIGVSVDSGTGIVYSMDYGDGAGRTSPNVTGIMTRTYNTPGEYHILVYANDMNETFEEQVASVAVRVDAPAGQVEVECDNPLATHEPGVCSVTVWSGSGLTCDVTVAYAPPISYTLPIEDPPLSLAGPPIPSKQTLAGDDTASNYLMIASEFSQSGKILAWELYAQVTGVITIMILKPGCNDYCYSSNTCTGSCDSTTQIVTTCSSAAFCMQYATCSDACSPGSRYTSFPDTYEISDTVTVNVASTGYQYLLEPGDVLVEPGYVLGLSHNTGDAQLGRVTASTIEEDISFTYNSPGIGNTVTVASGSGTSIRHAIRAIASGGSKIHLPFTFETAGNYTLTATASSRNLGSSPPSIGTTVIRVLEGINATILDGPDFGITGQNVAFTIEPHTGNDVLYNWTFGSDEYLMIAQSHKAHAFSSLGTYLINVTAYNSISSKYNFSTVIIQDEVLSLSISAPHTILNTPTEFSYSLSEGSNYTCEWDYGDSSAKETTDEVTTPLGSGTHQYTYSSVGEYTAFVNCSNDVSYATSSYTFKVQEEITNLRLGKDGEDKDTDFQIVVLLDSGSEVAWTLLFDSNPLAVTQDSTYQWSSPMQNGRGAVTIPVEVTAVNLVSNLSISVDFIILSKIVDPDLYIGFENVSSHTAVEFDVDVASGSDVTVDIDYKDGNTDSYTQTPGGEWSGVHKFSHTFTMGGRFQVTATFTNAEGSYPVVRELLVLVGVGSINCVMEEYALYHPPAEVSLTLEGTTMPTEPTLTLDWEGALYDPIQPPLIMNEPYNHTYGDTGVYTVTATLTNLLGTKECVMSLTVVEKLYQPQFDMPFPKAAIGQPFEIRFCLLRGPSRDLCNLTYEYGGGSTPAGPETVQRQGEGQLGCDSQFVTYNSYTPRTITVTATTPLEDISESYNVEIINGATDDELDLIPDSNINYESPKTFTIEYTGSKTSVDTDFSVAFGDGDVESHSHEFTSSATSTTVNHLFTKDGLLTATFTIENEAFRVVKNVSVGVYKTFSNPTASIYYIAEKPPGARLYGYDNNTSLYPIGKDIWFDVEDDNDAYADSYILTITKDGGTPVTQTYSSSEINYTLTEPGNYKASVRLVNQRNSADTTEYDIETFQLIEGLSVNETQLKVQVNEPKIFEVSFTSFGSQTCIYVDFGSGEARRKIFTDLSSSECTKPGYDLAQRLSLSSIAQIQETYANEGYYELQVEAVNPFSEMKTIVGFSVTGLDCTKPTVNIANKHIYFNVPEVFLRSDHIKIRGLSTIDCGQSYDNTKKWEIMKYDASYDTLEENIDISALVNGKAELNIPARFLKLGLYRITYTMEMQGDYGSNSFQATTFTYIQINASPLVGIMVAGGNSRITRGQAQTLTLDPKSLSLDPDVNPQLDQGISVSAWDCSLVEGGVDAGCDEIVPGVEKQVLDISQMSLKEYLIKATLQKSGRTAESTIVLEVVSGSPPVVVIQRGQGAVVFQESDGYKVLKSSPLPLDCICSSCTGSDVPLYNWTISLEDYRWPNGWRPLTEQETAARVIGKNSKTISIGAELFEDFDAAIMQAECAITVGSDTGSVSTTLKVNSAPSLGICNVAPFNRTFTQDQAWTISVSGWSDEDGIGEYQFFIHTSDDETERQVTSHLPQGNEFMLAVSLTEGYAYNDYEEEIFVKVRDTIGAINKHSCGKVIVRPIPLDEVQAFSENILTEELNEINRLFAEADQASCSQKSISLFSSLNSASKRSETEYAGYRMASSFANSKYGQIDADRPSYQQINELMNDPEVSYEMESDRNTRAKVRKDVLEMLNTLETQSVIAIQQVSSCFAEALISSDEIVQETQNSVMDSLNAMHDFMSNISNLENVPPQDIEVFLQNGVSTVGGIMDASGSNGYFGTLDELAEAQEDQEFLVYDSSITAGDDIEMEQASTFDEALALHTARVHKTRQAHTGMVVREKTTRALDKTAQIFNYLSVPSQEMEIKTVKMKMKMKKSNEENLKGETIKLSDSDGGITLPNISFLGDAQEPVIVSVSQATNYPIRYTDFAEKRISNSTNFITVNLYKEDNTKMSIASVSEPFKIVIPLDAHAQQPSYISMDPIITSWNNLMSFVSTINYTQSALFMDFGDLKGRQLLLVVKKGEEPKILADPADDQCDSVHLIPKSTTEDLDDPFRYRFFLGSDFLETFTGQLYVGVRELNSSEFDMNLDNGCASLPRYANGSDYFKGNFSLRQYVSQCLVIGDNDADWSTAGCTVGRETDVSSTVCYCTHLTTFAGGWVVVPNTIDWSYVFANADFLDNPTIYVTQIVIVVLFILAAIYARFKDKELKEKLGIAPLADNDPKDKYFYEIVVCTGMRRNAGTDSQVCFILSGEDDETEVRAFSDSKRKIFRRGQLDGFLMSVPRPLGYLNFMRIWHDNSGKGKFGSWYLNYVIVSDVQSGVKQVFISNKWFAVEEDDGQVDRVIPVAGREQLADFSYQFGERTRKNLADGHLWFSVVARPPQSRFTCLQRVSCILCLLYVTMLANAMFYNTSQEDEQANNAFAFGPFSVSPEQIFIGVISNLIVFPVNFLLIFLFRKSRPHHKRPSRIDRAIKEVSDSSKQTSINDVKPEVSSIFSVSKTPTLPHDLRDPDSSRPCTAMSMTNDKTALQPKKNKKCELPWYFVIIAWILLWVVTLGAALMVTFYGISFKDETCKKWISSMLVSFFMSVFITQPIKVFLFAVVLSLIIKNPGEEKEDEEDDEELHNTHSDDVLLHEEDNVFGAARPRKIGYKPPDPAVLERHRIRRMKEIKMWSIIREVIIYVFFLWILMVISYRQLGASHFLYKDTMHRVFIANNDTEIEFHKIRNTEEFWIWSKSGLINGLRSGSYYNDYPPLKLRAYVNDKVSRILGYATLRQLRIKPGLCEIPDEMKGIIDQCNVKYEIADQEEGTFQPGWLVMGQNDTVNDTREEYTYSNAESLNGYPYWGILSWYAGGGYVVPLKGSKEELIQKMDDLQEEKWIDKYTRAVFVEFTVYNPQVNLFAIGTILAEFHPSGGMVQSFRFEPAMLLPYMDSAMLFQLICEIVFLLFTLYFILHEIRELLRKRLNYFKSFWNLIELGIISMSITAIVIYFYRLILTNSLTKTFKESEGNGYVKFQYVAYWNETFSYMIGMLVFFATLKFLKLLRFNKKITLLSATLNHSAKSLLHFSIIFGIVFLAFAQLFYLTYMNIDIDYSTFISSVVASVLMMMGKFNIYTMIMAEPILTQIFVLLFVVSVTFVIVNMFVSILNETFTTVREDIKKQGNDYEIVDFMVQSFKKWTGIGGAPKQDENVPHTDKKLDAPIPSAPDYVQDFPDRIDRLLQSISAVYTDNDNFAKMYKKQPFQSGASNPKSFLGMQSQVSSRTPDLDRRRRDSSDVIARVHTH